MTNPRDIFLQQFKPVIDSKLDEPGKFRAVLTNDIGTTDSGSVWQDENARLIWFRAWGSGSPAWALCDVLEPILGLGVWIKFNPDIGFYEVLQDDPIQRSPSSDRSSYRAPTNEDFLIGGKFQLWLDPTLFIPISVYPTGSDTVNVVLGDYIYQGERKTFAGSVNLDLSGSRPAAGLHRLVGLYLDNANTLNIVNGGTIATASDAPEPTWPDGAFRVAVVDIDNATDISISDIDNRKVVWTEDDNLFGGAWPPPGKVYRWDVSAGLVIIEDDLPTAVSNAASGDVIVLGIGTYTLTNQLSIATNISIIGAPNDDQNLNFYTYITGDVTGGLILIDGNISLTNLYTENNATTGAGHGIVIEDGRAWITNCQIFGSSGDDVADGIYMDATGGTTQLYLFGGRVGCSPGTIGYAINLAVHSSTLQAFIYHPAYLDGDTADINAVANSEVRLFSPVLANKSLNGAGNYFGEFQNSDGILYKIITRVTAANYTTLSSDREIFGNTDGNAIALSLQAGVDNRPLRIVNTGTSSNALTITPNGVEHLLGVNSSFILNDGESLIIRYNATDGWY